MRMIDVEKALEDFESFDKILKDHLVESESDVTLRAEVRRSICRAVTTKYECLLVKLFANKSKGIDKIKDSVQKYIMDHAKLAKTPSKDCFHPALWREVTKVQAAKAKDKQSQDDDG